MAATAAAAGVAGGAGGAAGASAVYGLKYGARCISAVLGSSDAHRFLVATNSARHGVVNELHAIEYDEHDSTVRCKGVYAHAAGEVWCLAPAPTKPELLATAYRSGPTAAIAPANAAAAAPAAPASDAAASDAAASSSSSSAAAASTAVHDRVSVWRLKDDAKAAGPVDPNAPHKLDEVVELKGHSGTVRAVVWGAADDSRVVTCDSGTLRLWALDLGANPPAASCSGAASQMAVNDTSACAWDPHHTHQLTVATDDTTLRVVDLRAMKAGAVLERAHSARIRDCDYNPNKPSYIVTASDDRTVKFWDARKFGGGPLRVLSGHTHWVWSARYNRAHDQLLVSGSSDATVKLWSVVSISSAPLGELEDPANAREGDKLVKTYDEHEDSVYAVAWSNKNAWVWASVSHAGQVVLNHVPQPEMYKILL